MRNYTRKINSKSSFSRLIAATLTIGGISLLSPMIASAQTVPLTPAGTKINNTATGTYVDPNNPNTTLNATSNTVTVTVAEIAGITLVTSGVPVDSTPGTPISIGDTVTYTFTITNVGNDPTKFRIPNLATITGPGNVSGDLEYSYDGITFTPMTGVTEVITNSVDVGKTVQVRVKVVVQAGAVSGNNITVQLGNTTGSSGSQNVPLINNGGDVYTVDNPDSPLVSGEIVGTPVNGSREASATQQVTVGTVTKNLALATLLKTRGAYTNVTPTNTLIGDTVVYDLSLRVENTDVTGQGITPQPLAGYAGISVNGSATTNYILVSDVIPTGTALAATPTATASASGWIPVYSIDNISKPNAAAWTTTLPVGGLPAVKRVGFIKSTDTAGTPDPTQYIPVGTTVSGFQITVNVASEPGTYPLSINNIAQLVGQTPGSVSVYDESGDQNPDNYSGVTGAMTPGSTDANSDGVPDDGVTNNNFAGVADPTAQGVDSGNNNTGSGPGGEVNVLLISPQTAISIVNGPLNAASATGPDGTTATDFTNKSSLINPNIAPGSKIDPDPVPFGNTIQNNGTSPGTITIFPIDPLLVGNANLDLPNGTTVTITQSFDLTATTSIVYTYNQVSGTFTHSGTPISIPNVPAGQVINYGVEVNLPTGTKLSTDTIIDYNGDTEWGYPVSIKATISDGVTPTPTTSSNITIDRVYTGYLQLIKVSRILPGTGSPVIGTQGDFESTPAFVNGAVTIDPNPLVADAPRTPTPGNIIEYQIRYKNISSGQSGSGSVILNAGSVVITEDGTTGGNNWALLNGAAGGVIFTSNVVTPQAVDSNSGAITFFPSGNQSGTTQATDVTKYVDTLSTLIAPQGSGTFTFQRKIN